MDKEKEKEQEQKISILQIGTTGAGALSGIDHQVTIANTTAMTNMMASKFDESPYIAHLGTVREQGDEEETENEDDNNDKAKNKNEKIKNKKIR